jgi:two-component system nitrate/nitrite response regulator NarL
VLGSNPPADAFFQARKEVLGEPSMTTAFNPPVLAKRLNQLTARQKQVAALASAGHSNKVIARKLNISTGTVKSHLHTIYAKLGVKSRTMLIIVLSGQRGIESGSAH